MERDLDINFDIECMGIVPKNKNTHEGDKEYWNKYYRSNAKNDKQSLFAEYIVDMCEKGKSIVDFGCGTGRDSLYFHKSGLEVTAIDSSSEVIDNLKREHKGLKNISFVCGDFSNIDMDLFKKKYDYCYSRFSIHAVDDEKEKRLIENVYNSLNAGGMFFIEVRSIHDELYAKGEKVGRNTYFYNNHCRRFIVREELEAKLEACGFTIEYSAEERGFAPYGDADPKIIRIIVKK